MQPVPFEKPITVTRPSLPPLSEFVKGLHEIWQNRRLTNDGPVLLRYENALADFFQTPNLSLFSNGTLALQIGLQGLDVSGEVITTPFTFVATTHALYWNKIRPVFCDIEPDYFNLDPAQVEALITPWTTAILAVHVFGHPCRHAELEALAQRHHLRLIYDAAHAFGVRVAGTPIAAWGDMSMFSFHATKLYHTLEGGALVFREPQLKRKLDYLKNFGFKDETEVVMPGTNAKMNEIQALMGLQLLPLLDTFIEHRRQVAALYRQRLADTPGLHFPPAPAPNVRYNHAYVPVLVDESEFGLSRDRLYEGLKAFNVFTRRYFYPLVCDFSCYKAVAVHSPLTVARRVADQVVTLPIYSDLPLADVHRICDIILHLREAGAR